VLACEIKRAWGSSSNTVSSGTSTTAAAAGGGSNAPGISSGGSSANLGREEKENRPGDKYMRKSSSLSVESGGIGEYRLYYY